MVIELTESISLIRSTFRDFRACWKQLALTDVAYKIVAFIALTPLAGLLFRALLAVSGNGVLTDQDILFFFLGPVGWLCVVVVGAVSVGIAALEQAALTAVVANRRRSPIGILGALRFAAANAWPVLRLTARMVTLTLLAVAPFLAAAGLLYFLLLTEHDINYYLTEKPPVFLVAVGCGGVLATALIALLLRIFTGWSFALPLVLFEDVHPSRALRISRERAKGHRLKLLFWIAGWALASTVVSTLASAIVVGAARFFVPHAASSLFLLAGAIGVTLILWAAVNLAVNLLSTTTFATILFNLYRHLACERDFDSLQLDLENPAQNKAGFEPSRKWLFAGAIAGVILAFAIGVFAIRSVRLEDNVQITAHRGSSTAAPENTIAAVRQAIADGADWVEIDVQETADGKVVVFHDSDFMRVAGRKLNIWDATLSDLKDIDIGTWFDPKFKEQRVPTLTAVLKQCKGKIGVMIELKYNGHDEQLERRVCEVVEECDMAKEVVIMSLKAAGVKKIKSIRPKWKVGLLMSVFAGDLKNIDADFLAANAAFVDRDFVRLANRIGKPVHVWTVNDAATMSTMIGCGVVNIITDEPALARSVLQQRAQLSAPERLLLNLADSLGARPEIGEP